MSTVTVTLTEVPAVPTQTEPPVARILEAEPVVVDPAVFLADMARMHDVLAAAVVTNDDDGHQFIDETRVSPELLSAYKGLVSYGYANGLL